MIENNKIYKDYYYLIFMVFLKRIKMGENNYIEVEKVKHPIWEEFESLPESSKKQVSTIPQIIIGKWQYIYKSKYGSISLVSLPNYFRFGETLWEIFSFEDLFDDVERFRTRKEAEEDIIYNKLTFTNYWKRKGVNILRKLRIIKK